MKAKAPRIHLHKGDLPADVSLGDTVAVDTETMGLNPHRDQLCLVQLSAGDGVCHLVQLDRQAYDAPNLLALLNDHDVVKLFHFARFDVATLYHHLGALCMPVYCTKIASKLTRTFAERHGLKDLCRHLLGIEISKQVQLSDWGSPNLTEEQLLYAATDVLYLHKLREILDGLLEREGRSHFAAACFDFLPCRALLDLEGYADPDLFLH